MLIFAITPTNALNTDLYDVCRGAVVIEETEARARRHVICGDECGCRSGARETCVWDDDTLTTATVIGIATETAESTRPVTPSAVPTRAVAR